MVDIPDLQAGKAGEYLVCADLILKGHVAFLAEQGLSYDVVVDVDGRLLRLQVKTTRKPRAQSRAVDRTPVYFFNVRRTGKNGRRAYTSKDVDLFALVALDFRVIGYVSEQRVKQTMVCRIRDYTGLYYDELKSDRRKRINDLRSQGLSYRKIAELLEMDKSQAHRIAAGKQGGRRQQRYLDELSFENATSDLL